MSFIEGILIYLVVLLLIFIYSKITPDNKQGNVCVFAFILLTLFAGLSYDVGWDYLAYRTAILTGDIERFEFLERELMRLTKKAPQWFFLINHALIIGTTMWAVKKRSVNVLVSIFVFICFPFQFLYGLSTIRAAVVAAMTMWGYVYCLEERKNPLLFIAVIVVGFFIHQASLVGLLLLPIYYVNIGRIGNLVLLIATIFVARMKLHFDMEFLGEDVNAMTEVAEMAERLESYEEVETGGGSVIHKCFMALSVIGILFYDKLTKDNKYVGKYITIITIGYFLASMFSESPVLASRFSRPFDAFCVLLIPYFLSIVPQHTKKFATNAVLVLMTLLMLYQLYIPNYNGYENGRKSTYWPYRTIIGRNI